MNRTRTLLAAGVAAAVALLAPAALVSAQTDTEVRIVHGLNLEGQTDQDQGGTPVTICLDELSALPDFEFGEVLGPVPFPNDTDLPVVVLEGAGGDCAEPNPDDVLIAQLISLEGAQNTLILSYDIEEDEVAFGVLSDELITECTPPGTGGIAVGNAAATAGPLEIVVDGFENESIEYLQEFIYLGVPAGVNGVGVLPLFDEPLEIDLAPQQLISAYVVGGIPGFVDDEDPDALTPYVAVAVGTDLVACEEPPPAPTTAPAPAPAPAPTPAPAPAPAPRANTGERPLSLAG